MRLKREFFDIHLDEPKLKPLVPVDHVEFSISMSASSEEIQHFIHHVRAASKYVHVYPPGDRGGADTVLRLNGLLFVLPSKLQKWRSSLAVQIQHQ